MRSVSGDLKEPLYTARPKWPLIGFSIPFSDSKWINIQLSVLQIINTSTATMSANSSPSKKMAAQSTSPAASSPDSSWSQWLAATMAGALANLRGAKTFATEDSYLDVKPPNSLILEDSQIIHLTIPTQVFNCKMQRWWAHRLTH